MDARVINSLAEAVTQPGIGAGAMQIDLELVKQQSRPDSVAEYAVTIRAGERVLVDDKMSVAIPVYFGISETFGVGTDEGSPVLANYASGTPFPGRISNVVFDFKVR